MVLLCNHAVKLRIYFWQTDMHFENMNFTDIRSEFVEKFFSIVCYYFLPDAT